MNKKELRIKNKLVLCEHCDTPASWKGSVAVGWIGCMPCIQGEADSFDSSDLITERYADDFLKEFNKK